MNAKLLGQFLFTYLFLRNTNSPRSSDVDASLFYTAVITKLWIDVAAVLERNFL